MSETFAIIKITGQLETLACRTVVIAGLKTSIEDVTERATSFCNGHSRRGQALEAPFVQSQTASENALGDGTDESGTRKKA